MTDFREWLADKAILIGVVGFCLPALAAAIVPVFV